MPAPGFTVATDDVIAKLCQRIETGRTLIAVCRDDDMPSHEAIYQRMKRDSSVADAIARARQQSAHSLAESVVEIADSCTDPAMAQLIRNRCDQRRWLAGKFNAAYADKPPEVNVNMDLGSLIRASISAPTIEHEPAAVQQIAEADGKP